MKVVFLDIDGVLATPKQYGTVRTKLHKRDRYAYGLDIPYMWDERCVVVFNRFIRMNDAQIVISSDWRTRFTMDEMDMICKINGLAKSPIAFTPQFNKITQEETLESIRVREIQAWTYENKIAMWCAVDDMDLGALGTRFVQTDERMGFGVQGMVDRLEDSLYVSNQY
jgi:hypothetical protein